MGILDDAIREHLDLKRRQGAEDAEIQRLEDEAFGPPTRPGEPDFPDTGEQALAADAEAGTAVAESDERVEAPEPGFFDQTHGEPPPEAPDSAADEHVSEPPPPEPPVTEEPLAQVPLEMDDPAAPLEKLSEPPAPIEPLPEEPPIESLDTVEHHFEGAIEDTGEAEVVEAEPVEAEPHEEQLETGEEPVPAEGDEEDVLEETPEFLRDQPEDDELWFEQGEPKDFDF